MKMCVTKFNLKSKTKSWLKKIKRYNRSNIKINRKKSALLVIDMQNFFLEPGSSAYICGGAAILPNVKRLIDEFRKMKRPVIFTRHVHHPNKIDAGIMEWWWDEMCLEGSRESEIYPEIAPLPNEKVIPKHRYSAFYNTDLETILRVQKIEDLVITGVMTNLCCESTARDAYYRDYRVFFVADGTATMNEEMHTASLLNLAYGFAIVSTKGEILRAMQTKFQS